jgi:hypothetical protein
VHVYPDGSQDQDAHLRHALEALRVYGNFADACSIFVAIVGCLHGRSCLEILKGLGMCLNRSAYDLLTQKCVDKRPAFRSGRRTSILESRDSIMHAQYRALFHIYQVEVPFSALARHNVN